MEGKGVTENGDSVPAYRAMGKYGLDLERVVEILVSF